MSGTDSDGARGREHFGDAAGAAGGEEPAGAGYRGEDTAFAGGDLDLLRDSAGMEGRALEAMIGGVPPFVGREDRRRAPDGGGGGGVGRSSPSYHAILARLVLVDGIMIDDPLRIGGQQVDSKERIGRGQENEAAIVQLAALADGRAGSTHAGILNNLACAYAWRRAFEPALTRLQQALDDSTPDYKTPGGSAAKLVARENADIIIEASEAAG